MFNNVKHVCCCLVVNIRINGCTKNCICVDSLHKRKKTTGCYTTKESAYGYLHKYANPDLIEKEKDAWIIAVKEKYGTS